MASIAKRGKSYCVIYPYVNEQGETKQKWESFKTHKEAKARKQTIEYEMMTGTFVAPKELTVEEFMEDFVRLYGEQRWSLGMYTGTVGTIRNYVNPIIGNLLIQSITTRDVEVEMITKVYAHILDEDRKINAQKFDSAFYSNPDLRQVKAPQAQGMSAEQLLAQLKESPELANALAQMLASGKAG